MRQLTAAPVRLVLLAVVAVLVGPGPVAAVTRTWIDAAGGDWSDGSKWEPAGAPQPGEDVFIDLDGTYQVTLDVDAQVTSVTVGATTGTQALVVGQTLTLADTSTIGATAHLTLGGGTIDGAGNVIVHGSMDWTSGTMAGAGTTSIEPGALLALTTGNTKYLRFGRTVIVFGDATWSGGTITMYEGSHWTQDTGSTFAATADDAITSGDGGADETFANGGALTRSGTGSSTFAVGSFVNTGVVEALSGELHLATSYEDGGGTLRLSGGTITATTSITLTSGRLEGSGMLGASLVNGGTVSPGASPGKLDVTGDYTQAPEGMLEIEIAGAEAGSKFDQLAVDGTVTLDGDLIVVFTEGFAPEPGEKFAIIMAEDIAGTFASVDATDATGAKFTASADVTASGVSLSVPVAVAIEAPSAGDGNSVLVPVALHAGPQCVSALDLRVLYPATDLTWDALDTPTAACVVAAEDEGGVVHVTATCSPGVADDVALGTLRFSRGAGVSLASLAIRCGDLSASDCASPAGAVTITCGDQAPDQVECVAGDLFPDGVGDGRVSLADFVLGRRKILGTVAIADRDLTCGDLFPGVVTCDPAVGPSSWCVEGNDLFQLSDVLTIRRVVSEILTLGCVACRRGGEAGGPSQPLPATPGDVTGDGAVDVTDVIRVLRMSVALDEVSEGADVAPPRVLDGAAFAAPDGKVDVGDVVLLLRSAVGLVDLRWPLHELTLSPTDALAGTALLAVVDGWPAGAAPVAFTSPACADDGGVSGLDVGGGRLALTCAGDGFSVDAGAPLAVIHYSSQRALAAGGLTASVVALGVDDTECRVSVEIESD